MHEKTMDRREFLKHSLAGVAAIGALQTTCSADIMLDDLRRFDDKGLPTRPLGRTGARVSMIGLGGGSRFCSIDDPEESERLLNLALDSGIYYWDTSYNYVYDGVVGEERYGAVLKDRRREVFLATKVESRGYDGAMRQIETSLNRLQTDHLDLCQIHSVRSTSDVDKVAKPDSVYKALRQLKDEKVVRLIGFSGHKSARAMKALVERLDFDTMLIALNHYQDGDEPFEEDAIPAAAEKGMGVMVIKVIRPRESVSGITPQQLIRYALTLEHVDAAVIGMDRLEDLQNNVRILADFKPLTPEQMEEMKVTMAPFYQNPNLPWMQPGYRDGAFA